MQQRKTHATKTMTRTTQTQTRSSKKLDIVITVKLKLIHQYNKTIHSQSHILKVSKVQLNLPLSGPEAVNCCRAAVKQLEAD